MFQFSYSTFLTVSILHPFYTKNVSDDFEFTALPQTAAILDGYGLKYKNINGTLVIFQQLDQDKLPFQEIDTILDLFFSIRIKTDLLNITALTGAGKYWFSNLREDGSYNCTLTKSVALGAGDELPVISRQQTVINFLPGIISAVTVSRIAAGTGWTSVSQAVIDAKSSSLKLDINQAGLYLMEKELVAGGKETSHVLFSNEMAELSNTWSFVHLQVKPGDNNLVMTIPLKPKESVWQYYLVEPEGRLGGAINAADLAMAYSVPATSRYPASTAIKLTDPGTYPAPVKQYVNGIMSGDRIKKVYLFESDAALSILDGEQPQVKIKHQNKDIAGKAIIPARSMNNTSIIYKL